MASTDASVHHVLADCPACLPDRQTDNLAHVLSTTYLQQHCSQPLRPLTCNFAPKFWWHSSAGVQPVVSVGKVPQQHHQLWVTLYQAVQCRSGVVGLARVYQQGCQCSGATEKHRRLQLTYLGCQGLCTVALQQYDCIASLSAATHISPCAG